jgi:hypothetical protein
VRRGDLPDVERDVKVHRIRPAALDLDVLRVLSKRLQRLDQVQHKLVLVLTKEHLYVRRAGHQALQRPRLDVFKIDQDVWR